jgi:hypothetical protein
LTRIVGSESEEKILQRVMIKPKPSIQGPQLP